MPTKKQLAELCADLRPRKIARDFKAAETGSDDDDMMTGFNCHSWVRSMRSGIDHRPVE